MQRGKQDQGGKSNVLPTFAQHVTTFETISPVCFNSLESEAKDTL